MDDPIRESRGRKKAYEGTTGSLERIFAARMKFCFARRNGRLFKYKADRDGRLDVTSLESHKECLLESAPRF